MTKKQTRIQQLAQEAADYAEEHDMRLEHVFEGGVYIPDNIAVDAVYREAKRIMNSKQYQDTDIVCAECGTADGDLVQMGKENFHPTCAQLMTRRVLGR